MHDDEVETDADLVRRLLRAQVPALADLPIERFPTDGTDHAIYRVGDELSARLPLIAWAADQAELEARWLPRLAPLLPVPLHEPLELCEPGEGYPFPWAVYRWLPGAPAHPGRIVDPEAFASQAAELVLALRAIDLPDVPRSPRGHPLRLMDETIRTNIDALRDDLRADAEVLVSIWEDALAAPKWAGDWVVAHGDLTSGNVLVDERGRLCGLIDWSIFGRADPANDLELGWDVFDAPTRARFWELLDVDDATWRRSRAWAVRSVGGITYYRDTNPGIVERCWRRLRHVIEDERARQG